MIPESLQQRHQDKSSTARENLFPNIDNLVKSTIDQCIACQAVGKPKPPKPPKPLAMTDMPKGPWEMVHMDFYGPLPSGEYLLVVIDRYSRFSEVEIVRSTKTSTVILDKSQTRSLQHIPTIVKTDNGPPFNGDEYSHYMKTLGIKPEFATPRWSQGNAEVERFMQPLGQSLKAAKIEGRPWQQELNRFLLQYRTTLHITTGVPPAELLFNRTVRGNLPTLHKRNVVNRHKQARGHELKKQQYNKQYADTKRNTKIGYIN